MKMMTTKLVHELESDYDYNEELDQLQVNNDDKINIADDDYPRESLNELKFNGAAKMDYDFKEHSNDNKRQSTMHNYAEQLCNDDLFNELTYPVHDNQYVAKREYVCNDNVDNQSKPRAKECVLPETKVTETETMMMNLAHMIHLPRPDLATFDGDPLRDVLKTTLNEMPQPRVKD